MTTTWKLKFLNKQNSFKKSFYPQMKILFMPPWHLSLDSVHIQIWSLIPCSNNAHNATPSAIFKGRQNKISLKNIFEILVIFSWGRRGGGGGTPFLTLFQEFESLELSLVQYYFIQIWLLLMGGWVTEFVCMGICE